MIKDCTSVEQGRMLVALGISSSTADKCWIAMESGKDEPALYPLSLEQARENRMTADRFLTDIAKKSKPDALTPAWSLTALLDLLPFEIKNGSRTYSFRMNKVGDEYQICYSDNQCFSLKKVGSSKYAFYTLSKRPLLTYLTFFYGCSGFYAGFIGAKVKKLGILLKFKPHFCQ